MIDKAGRVRWREAVIARDGQCVRCGEDRREFLTAHHIISKQWRRADRDLRNGVTVCTAPRLRWVESAGEAQVIPCHDWAEGEGKATSEDWFAWGRPGAVFQSREAWEEFARAVRG